MTEPLVSDPGEIENNPVLQALRAWDPGVVAAVLGFRGELTVVIAPEQLIRTAVFLRDQAGLEFNFLSDIAVVDRFPLEPRFEMNYHLTSFSQRRVVRLRLTLPGANPAIETLTTVWPTANWMEREIYDLFGVHFAGHPDLQRILMPDDWEGFPLRKDYPVEGYR